jgi:hypothetical protein
MGGAKNKRNNKKKVQIGGIEPLYKNNSQFKVEFEITKNYLYNKITDNLTIDDVMKVYLKSYISKLTDNEAKTLSGNLDTEKLNEVIKILQRKVNNPETDTTREVELNKLLDSYKQPRTFLSSFF